LCIMVNEFVITSGKEIHERVVNFFIDIRNQKQGIGKGIIDHLMKDEHLLFGLTSSFVAQEFYEKLGFKRHKTAVAKYPGQSTYLED
ncbi:MAG: GNAT family N-acetyltransferase, partial [Clostridia bacterium]|nr:GNAT family N-acetyltransferase [Clostridia bacterium]